MYQYLDDLNEAQRAAVEYTEGPSLVVAGAGSGKTRVLTYRVAHLLAQGVRASNILALTFTNKAAREMKERIGRIVGEHVSRYLWMGTFHSIFARILRVESGLVGYPSNFTIYDTADAKNLVKKILKDFKLDDKTYKPGVVMSRISAAKNNLIAPAAYAQSSSAMEYDRSIRMPLIADIYKEYAKRCHLSGAMDFDDLLMKTYRLFDNHCEVLEKYQAQFKYLLVDEYQDTNRAQYLIIQQLAEKHNNICVVGDDAQSIYSFRGARIENILNFQNDYPQHKIFKLEQNYRSTQTIVNAANSIIAKNKRQLHKNLYSENSVGEKINVVTALTDNEEGYLIAGEVYDLRANEHLQFQDFAILYRTNAQSRIFEEALRKRNIPYKIYGGMSFYQRKEIKDILAYFRLIINHKDNEAFKRVINYPARGIGQTTLGKLESAAITQGVSIWDIAQNLEQHNPGLNRGTTVKVLRFVGFIKQNAAKLEHIEAYELAKEVAESSGLLKDLYQDKSPEGMSRFENTQELLNGIQEFTVNAREEGNTNRLYNYMEDVALLTDQDTEKEEDRNRVTLMTVHSAKGLEFNVVFVVGVEDKLFPAQYGGSLTLHELEEERRLFYVALTRAQQRAYISWARQRYKWGNLDFCEPSRFIAEMDPQFLEGADRISGRSEKIESTGGILGNRLATAKRPTTATPQPHLSRKLVKVNRTSTEKTDFQGDDPSAIQSGMVVEHQRFGQGKVLQIEGVPPNVKAVVFFNNVGQKQLLLKFAKLKIVR